MKKIILTLVLLVVYTVSYGQTKYQERQNKYFVEAAAKEFKLDKDQQVTLATARLEMVKAYQKSQKAFKGGEITKEEKQTKNRAASKAFNNAVIKLTGKKYKDLAPFFKRMRQELKEVK